MLVPAPDERELVSVGAGRGRVRRDLAFDDPTSRSSARRSTTRARPAGCAAPSGSRSASRSSCSSVTALLVNAAPACDANSGPWIGYIKTPTLWYDTNVVPAWSGPNDMHFTAMTPGGAPKDVLEMTAEATDVERGLGPIDIPLRRLAPGHYFSPGFRFPFAGDWKLTVKALVDETNEVTGTAEIPIR